MPRMRWRPGLRPGPRWGSSRRSPSGWGGGYPSQEPHPTRRTRRLDPHVFGARCSAPSVPHFYSVCPPLFLAIHHWMMIFNLQ